MSLEQENISIIVDCVKSNSGVEVKRHDLMNNSHNTFLTHDGPTAVSEETKLSTNQGDKERIMKPEEQSDTTRKCSDPVMKKTNEIVSFPMKLMDILSDEDHSDIISWLSHGKGFMIYKTKEFVTNVMPKYFKQTKFPSFTRKLSRWGFRRVQRGPEVGVYYHELFNRDDPHLCLHIRCLPTKNGTPYSHNKEQVFSIPKNEVEGDLSNINPSINLNSTISGDLLNLNMEQDFQSELFDDRLLELLLLKRKHREAQRRKSLSAVPDNFLRNSYGAVLHDTRNTNILGGLLQPSLQSSLSSQYSPGGNIDNRIADHIMLNNNQARRAALGKSSYSSVIESVLARGGGYAMSPRLAGGSNSTTLSTLWSQADKKVLIEAALQDPSLVKYLL